VATGKIGRRTGWSWTAVASAARHRFCTGVRNVSQSGVTAAALQDAIEPFPANSPSDGFGAGFQKGWRAGRFRSKLCVQSWIKSLSRARRVSSAAILLTGCCGTANTPCLASESGIFFQHEHAGNFARRNQASAGAGVARTPALPQFSETPARSGSIHGQRRVLNTLILTTGGSRCPQPFPMRRPVPFDNRVVYFIRTSALFPCAPKPSSSANFFTDFSAFLSEARLYSTTLVRRWN